MFNATLFALVRTALKIKTEGESGPHRFAKNYGYIVMQRAIMQPVLTAVLI